MSVATGAAERVERVGRREERLIRRLDWRFLMDDPALNRVAYAGPDSGTLLPALRREARSVTDLRETGERPGRRPADLAVLRRPTRRELERASGVLEEGGTLYCEIERPAGPAAIPGGGGSRPRGALTARGAAAALRELGFTDLRIHLHYPSFEECREIVPLEPASLSLALGRHLPRLPAVLQRIAGKLGARVLPHLAPVVSLLAVRGDRRRSEGPPVSWAGLSTGRPPPVAVTPRFRASGHVILLIPDGRGSRPARVVKVSRRAGRPGSLVREAGNLRRIQEVRGGGFDSVPRLRSTGRVRGTPFLVETGLGGRPMDRSFVRRRPERSVEAVTDWLLRLHRATARRGEPPEGSYRRLLSDPLERLARSLSLDGDEMELVVETRRLTRPLARNPWPTVFEHGDLGHPNLLWDGARGPGVVDWEGADPAGLPAADLFFFLAYVGFARHRATRPSEYVDAFERTFFSPSPAVEGAVDRYASGLEIPPSLWPALFTACWARRVVRLLDRLAPADGEPSASGGETAAWIRGHRYVAIWRRAVRRADDLRLGEGGAT